MKKNMFAILISAVLCCVTLSGCFGIFNSKRAAELTEEYMKTKYGKSIKNITHDDRHGNGDRFEVLTFDLDPDEDCSDQKKYSVQVLRDRQTKKNYYVNSDNFLADKTIEIVSGSLKEMLDEISLNENRIYIYYVNQLNADHNFFFKEYTIPDSDSFRRILSDYTLCCSCTIIISESSYSENKAELFCRKISEFIDDDRFHIDMDVYTDDDYSIVKDFSSEELCSKKMWYYEPVAEKEIDPEYSEISE
ncbi:MAG: hypothetical protein Q4F95_06065 [Oscillospiraceae bacterium]|nr:hypothetical protein [Oscillospiraceae bacterium]